MRLLICAGGTGGGVYPALAVLQTLSNDAMPVLWIGNQTGMDADLVQRAGVQFAGIPSAGLHGVGLLALPGNLLLLWKGYLKSRRIIHDFQPEVILFTGGFIAAPVALAGYKIPSLLYVPDIQPGYASKLLARLSKCIAVTAQESRKYFKLKPSPIVTGYPVRPELMEWKQGPSREKLNLKPGMPVLLVFGGSKGAQSINEAILKILPSLLNDIQVIHISGSVNWKDVEAFQSQLPESQSSNYHAYPYLHQEMGAALASADLVISRAGASTLGEFPHFGLPAILVPYPFAWRYQKVNADFLTSNGAAIVIENSELNEKLLSNIQNILNQPEKLEKMREAMRSLDNPQAANQIADLLRKLAKHTSHVEGMPT